MAIANTTAVQSVLDRLITGHLGARDELFRIVYDRLLIMIRPLLAGYPGLRRWVQSDDVLQNVQIRLLRCLDQIPVLYARDFFALTATNIRREILDLGRHYFGQEGAGKNYATPNLGQDGGPVPLECPGANDNPAILAEWVELHRCVADLPEDERAVVELHWYHGLPLVEVVTVLDISLATVNRRWASARAILAVRLVSFRPADLESKDS